MAASSFLGRLRKRGKGKRGYTMVEIAMAMTLFGIGAGAVVAMERTSVQGDLDARKQDIATYIATEWIERLHRDATNWNLPNTLNPTGTDNRASATTYLKSATTDCVATDAGALSFTLPSAPSSGNMDGLSYAFDMFGRDMSVSGGASKDTVFCVQLSQCIEGYDVNKVANLVQATIRVVWPRRLQSTTSTTAVGDATNWCSAAGVALPDATTGAQDYRVVSETTLLQRTAF